MSTSVAGTEGVCVGGGVGWGGVGGWWWGRHVLTRLDTRFQLIVYDSSQCDEGNTNKQTNYYLVY